MSYTLVASITIHDAPRLGPLTEETAQAAARNIELDLTSGLAAYCGINLKTDEQGRVVGENGMAPQVYVGVRAE